MVLDKHLQIIGRIAVDKLLDCFLPVDSVPRRCTDYQIVDWCRHHYRSAEPDRSQPGWSRGEVTRPATERHTSLLRHDRCARREEDQKRGMIFLAKNSRTTETLKTQDENQNTEPNLSRCLVKRRSFLSFVDLSKRRVGVQLNRPLAGPVKDLEGGYERSA